MFQGKCMGTDSRVAFKGVRVLGRTRPKYMSKCLGFKLESATTTHLLMAGLQANSNPTFDRDATE